ncbi:MAG: hypothetical protein M1G31_34685 [Pseudanabaena sp. Salubria-1]|nr:hypothetical protein [Pseudanabaena sp. Salubria-1]
MHRENKKYLPRRAIVIALKTFIVGICFLIFYCLLTLIIPLIISGNLGITEFGNLYSEKLNKPLFVFHIYEVKNPSTSVAVELDHFVLPPNVCVDGITLAVFGYDSRYKPPYKDEPDFSSWAGTEDTDYHYKSHKCSKNERVLIDRYELLSDNNRTEKKENIVGMAEMPIYYFPFDERSLYIGPHISLYTNDNEKQKIVDYEIAGWVTAPNSDEKIIFENSDRDRQPNIRVYLYRPFAYRALTLILLGSLFLFIISLAFLKDNGTFLEVSIGILFGLWGVQNILIPQNIKDTTIISSLILTLYICFVFVAFIRFVRFILWRWLDQFYQGD